MTRSRRVGLTLDREGETARVHSVAEPAHYGCAPLAGKLSSTNGKQ
jgi:hypothetical protein